MAADAADRAFKPKRQPEYAINTSALRRAFPDFSDYASSEEDSVELGRGANRHLRRLSSNAPPSDDPSRDLTFTMDGESFRVTGTPPIKNRQHKTTKQNNPPSLKSGPLKRATSEKENQDPLKTTDYVSGGSSQDDRRNPARLQPTVESDDSMSLKGELVDAAKHQPKSTRFAPNKDRRQPLGESKPASNAQPTEQPRRDGHNRSAHPVGTPKNQSFVLPDIPNITELVSGVRQDGTPLFTRTAKPQSRFTTANGQRHPRKNHAPVDDVPAPTEERALYLSLQLLQEKVAKLEEEKGKTEAKLEDYELEVLQLRSKIEEREANQGDSGVGFEADEEEPRDWQAERSSEFEVDSPRRFVSNFLAEFEENIKALRLRLHQANQKVAVSENQVKNLTKDRDAAHQQLAVAYVNSEELKNESDAVRAEIENAKAQLTKVTKQHGKRIDWLMRQETELRQKIERREKAISEMSSLAKELWDTRNAMASDAKREPMKPNKTASMNAQPLQQSAAAQTNKQSSGTSRTRPSDPYVERARRHQQSSKTGPQGKSSRFQKAPAAAKAHTYDAEAVDRSDAESATDQNAVQYQSAEFAKNETYLSFMEGDEPEKLRYVLNEDKAKLTGMSGNPANDVQNPARKPSAAPSKTVLPRKSSLKDIIKRPQDLDRARSRVVRDDDPLSKEFNFNASEKDDTRRSVFSQISDHRARRSAPAVADADQTENMTSALILPDITLTGNAANNKNNPQTTTMTDHAGQAQQHVIIPRPVPVSSQPRSAHIAATDPPNDPTIRPSHPPGVALAHVLHSLEAELTNLRSHLADLENKYRAHDTSLGQRKRKDLAKKIVEIMKAIEIRSDQIYGLYDVLEGQKGSGDAMVDKDVEVTLMGLGIDVGMVEKAMQYGNAAGTLNAAGNNEYDESASEGSVTDDDAEELPWEGIETTQSGVLGSLKA